GVEREDAVEVAAGFAEARRSGSTPGAPGVAGEARLPGEELRESARVEARQAVGGLGADPDADRGRIERHGLAHGVVDPVEILDRGGAVERRVPREVEQRAAYVARDEPVGGAV